jgi:poly(hydroxyalkanoate) granule-associated protein
VREARSELRATRGEPVDKEGVMVKKLKKLAKKSRGGLSETELVRTVRDSAQQIWLAGLGAWGKTRDEGVKVFNALVKEGKGIESHTRKLAGARVGIVTSQMSKAASGAQARATATWDKLEHVFEQRVARALHRLGVPTSKEIEALTRRVESLTASVEKLGGAPARRAMAAKRSRKMARKKVPPKAPARKEAAKSSASGHAPAAAPGGTGPSGGQ